MDEEETVTSQEMEIIQAIRARDGGRRDGDLANCFAQWARGTLHIHWAQPAGEDRG